MKKMVATSDPVAEIETKAFEKAAKYICTANCGLCPMVVEKFPCPKTCDMETMAWHCWMVFFRSATLRDERGNENKNV